MELWNEYVDLLKPAGDLISKTWAPQSDKAKAELCRQLAMNLSQGYFLLCQSDANHPEWSPFENSVFLLQPNPDAVYYYAPVSGQGTYRIVGEDYSNPRWKEAFISPPSANGTVVQLAETDREG